jgi:hypothetical protein
MHHPIGRLCAAVPVILPASVAGTIATFQDDIMGFEAAVGAPVPIVLDFDTLTPGTDLAGGTWAGATLTSPNGNTLEVVRGEDTFTPAGFSGVADGSLNRLYPTSGDNVLSPGGVALVPGDALGEHDSLQIDFAVPQAAVGLDVLMQSLDSALYTHINVFDAGGVQIDSFTPSGPGQSSGPGGSVFVGFVSDHPSTHIGHLVIVETDNNAVFPDSNIGYDTIRYASIAGPASCLLPFVGLIPLVAHRHRGRTLPPRAP